MNLSPQQADALDAVKAWTKDPDKQVFRLFGYAGTGKTTIAKEFAEAVGGSVLYAAYTGKACLVLQEKGCPARTIHSLIYTPADKSKERLEELEEQLAEMKKEHKDLDYLDNELPVLTSIKELEEAIEVENKRTMMPSFQLNPESDLKDAALLVVDEVSMVGTRMALDLLSFDVKILVLGDPAQLPPVGDSGFFTNRDADFLLDEIHRQAADSPVLQLATRVRSRQKLEYGDYGNSAVIRKGELRVEDLVEFDQILCGTNKTRRFVNRDVRDHLGFTNVLPEEGDRLVCLRNDNERGLLNGSQWTVVSKPYVMSDDVIMLDIESEHGVQSVSVWRHYFEGRESDLRSYDITNFQAFDYSYAMTVHKSQGSSWPRVLVIDESWFMKGEAHKHLYTAITRASEAVTIVR